MNRENVSMVIGMILLVLGIAILFFVFFQAFAIVQAPEEYFDEHFPELTEEKAKGPTAEFSLSATGLTVQFEDRSTTGDASITRWEWEFGDGTTSDQPSPSHTYSDQGDYNVRLRVVDGNGEESRARANINVEPGNNFSDYSERDENGVDVDFDFGNMFVMLALMVVTLLYFILFLVGAAFLKAGWNLIKPGPSTVKLKLKPKKVEAEFEGTGQPYPHQGTPPYYPQQQQGGAPPPGPQAAQQGIGRSEYPPDEEELRP